MIIGNGNMPGGTGEDWVLQQYLTKTLSEIYDEEVEKVRDYAFNGCSALTTVNFPNATSIGPLAFYNCSALTAFYLPSTSICSLAETDAFAFTPLTGTGSGFIYVPASLVDSYKVAPNWSNFASHITAI